VADFVANTTDIGIGNSVQFTDLSTGNPTEWLWTFEGGTPTSSTDQDPSITYNTAGTYAVTLTATNSVGSDDEIKTAYITVHNPPVVDFVSDKQNPNEGGTINFTDLSTNNPTNWTWTFEGGTPASSNAQHPSVVYNTAGTYSVTLEASNAYGSDIETKTDYITVIHVPAPPVADFSASNTAVMVNESIDFTDLSTNNPTTWSWTFEGGTPATSTSQHAGVTYGTEGVYTVELTVTNADGSDTETKIDYITVSSAPAQTELSFTDFEGGWGIWTDGGGDCSLYTGGTYAWSGSNAADIQDNSGVASSFYLTNGVDIHTAGYAKLEIEFYFIAVSMDNTKEDFWVQYFDGSTWHTVATFARNIDFDNNVFYVATVSVFESDYTFSTDMKIRFMCDASGNRDDVYIDDIRITASTDIASSSSSLVYVEALQVPFFESNEIEEPEIKVYPNPVQDQLKIDVPAGENVQVYIFNTTGQLMYEGRELDLQESINVSSFKKGLYIVKVISDGEVFTTKLIKQ